MGISCKYLSDDHGRLDDLLECAAADGRPIDIQVYSNFPAGLLHHVVIEEKIVMPAIKKFQNGREAEVAARLRRDHGALAGPLVPSPTPSIVTTIRSILRVRNPLEEKKVGLCQILDKVTGEEGGALLEKMRAVPEVRALSHDDPSGILDATCRAVERAGHRAAF